MTEHFNPRKARGIVAVRADAGGDPKQILAGLNKAFEEFKQANNERIAALEKGKADVVTDEKVDRINAAVTELKEAHETAQKSLQDRIDEIEAAANRPGIGGGNDGATDVKAEAVKFLAGLKGVTETKVDDADVQAYAEYTKTFASYLRRGDKTNDVQAAMQVGSDPDGGYWVPTQMSDDIKTRIFDTSPMRQVASAITITTDSIAFPVDANDATSGGFVGETESRTETDTPQLGEQTIYCREQYAEPRATQKLLDMATVDVEAWLNGKIADKMARVENARFVTGTGVKAPRGFLDYKGAAVATDDASRSWGVLQQVLSGASGGFPSSSGKDNPDALITIIQKLNPAYRAGAVFAMNRATEAAIRKLKDADGRYLVGMGDLQDNATGFSLLGYRIVNMEDMPDLGSDSYSLAFGNFGVGYQIVDGRGIRILRDPFTTKGYVKFYTTKWTGGDVVNFDAIKLMKFASS